jgi:DNA-binding transcriptional MerR regulator
MKPLEGQAPDHTTSAALRIGELSRHTGLSTASIRFYEQQGLLPPPVRLANNYRLYGPEALRRLQFIAQCRALDMSLDEVRSLLAHEAAPGDHAAHQVIDEHLAHVRERLAALQSLERRLLALRASCCAGPTDACGVVQAIGDLGLEAAATHRGAVHRGA